MTDIKTDTTGLNPTELLNNISDIDQVSRRVQLANHGLALPMLGMLRGQSQFEAARLADTDAPESEVKRRRATAARADVVQAEFTKETSRLKALPPTIDADNEAAVYGRVADQGSPVSGVTIMALAESNELLEFACTGDDGDFKLSFPAPSVVRLRVVSKDGAELHVDAKGAPMEEGQRRFREIELTKATPPCPTPDTPPPPVDDKTVGVPNLIGNAEAVARDQLSAVGLRVGQRSTEPNEQRGLVLRQEPKARAEVEVGSAVDIIVGSKLKFPVPDVVGLPSEGASQVLEKAGLRTTRTANEVVSKDKAGLVLRQSPEAGTDVEDGDVVRLTIGEAGVGDLADIAESAEGRLREREVGNNRSKGWLLKRLTAAGVSNAVSLDELLAKERQTLREIFEVSTLKMVDLIGVELRRAYKDTVGD